MAHKKRKYTPRYSRQQSDPDIKLSSQWQHVGLERWDYWASVEFPWYERLMHALKRRGLSTYRAAKLTGVTRGAFSHWRADRRISFTIPTLVRLARGLGVAPWELLEEILTDKDITGQTK